MINIDHLLYSPNFNQTFTIWRKTGDFAAGRFVETETTLEVSGVVLPATNQEIMQFPEGDRSTAMMVFYAEQEMFTTHTNDENGNGTSDEIEWRAHRYRVLNVATYGDYGYYKAYGVYMESD
jgi:hypothetical protein